MLERNEKRNKALGIPTKPTNIQEQKSFDKENNKKFISSPRKSVSSSPRKSQSNNELVRAGSSNNKTPVKTKTFSSKNDADVAVEINITSTQNIQVVILKKFNQISEEFQISLFFLSDFSFNYSFILFRLRLKLPNVNMMKMAK